jgi:hypothetical protein
MKSHLKGRMKTPTFLYQKFLEEPSNSGLQEKLLYFSTWSLVVFSGKIPFIHH